MRTGVSYILASHRDSSCTLFKELVFPAPERLLRLAVDSTAFASNAVQWLCASKFQHRLDIGLRDHYVRQVTTWCSPVRRYPARNRMSSRILDCLPSIGFPRGGIAPDALYFRTLSPYDSRPMDIYCIPHRVDQCIARHRRKYCHLKRRRC